MRIGLRLFALALASVFLSVVFSYIACPWYQRWGAAEVEISRPLLGDELIANAASQETRAITINAPIERVWPWLAQLGQDRGGFYSYDLLENAVGCAMPTEDRLRPAAQTWQIGDKLWMYPKDRAGGIGFATLHAYVPGRALAFGTRVTGASLSEPESGSWAFVLEPIDASTTRFLVRGRIASGRSPAGVAFDRAIFEPAHFVMERRMMVGIKDLAEGRDRGRLLNHGQVALWTITFVLFVSAGIMVLRRRAWARPLAAFTLAGLIFQVLTLAQPPLLLGVPLVAMLGAIVFL